MIDSKLIDPSSTALIVVDKQAGYFDKAMVEKRQRTLPENSDQVLKSIDEFINDARRSNVPIIWTKMVEDSSISPEPIKSLITSGLSISKPGDPSFDIVGLQPLDNEKVITKYYYNAFVDTELSDLLKSVSVKSVIFVGGYATRCILSSVVGASGDGLISIVPRGLVINQQAHANEMDTLYSIVDAIFGYTPKPEEIISAWAADSSP